MARRRHFLGSAKIKWRRLFLVIKYLASNAIFFAQGRPRSHKTECASFLASDDDDDDDERTKLALFCYSWNFKRASIQLMSMPSRNHLSSMPGCGVRVGRATKFAQPSVRTTAPDWCCCTIVGQRICGELMETKSTFSPHPPHIIPTASPLPTSSPLSPQIKPTNYRQLNIFSSITPL